jgi:hypothetical protein
LNPRQKEFSSVPNIDMPGHPITNWDRGSATITREQIALAAELLNMDAQAAQANAYDIRDGIVCTYSNIRGLGSVLIGPDMSVLFFASYVALEDALEEWDAGRRTPQEEFAILHVEPDGTRRPPSR